MIHCRRLFHPSPNPSLCPVLLYLRVFKARAEMENRGRYSLRLMWRNSCILMNTVTTSLATTDVVRYVVDRGPYFSYFASDTRRIAPSSMTELSTL